MSKDTKVLVSGAEANFLQAMLNNAEKKYTPPVPNTADENPDEIAKVTKELQAKWAKKHK